MSRFDYVQYDDEASKKQVHFKVKMMDLEEALEKHLPNGRAKALVLTKLEEAYCWIGKAIRDDQINRDGYANIYRDGYTKN